jgi:UDP-N-acetylglucosamine--N-acetylmuramyl-(pentapeptide) pyrophosphoryl-undecaprenol N-acetylglucosamine transferase
VVSFLDDMPARYASADVVLCRAGAITVSELAAAGVASILVPLTVSTTSHQRDNARFMEESGGAIHVPQTELTAAGLAQLFRSLTRDRLLALAIAARAQAQPHATEKVADLCVDAARR